MKDILQALLEILLVAAIVFLILTYKYLLLEELL